MLLPTLIWICLSEAGADAGTSGTHSDAEQERNETIGLDLVSEGEAATLVQETVDSEVTMPQEGEAVSGMEDANLGSQGSAEQVGGTASVELSEGLENGAGERSVDGSIESGVVGEEEKPSLEGMVKGEGSAAEDRESENQANEETAVEETTNGTDVATAQASMESESNASAIDATQAATEEATAVVSEESTPTPTEEPTPTPTEESTPTPTEEPTPTPTEEPTPTPTPTDEVKENKEQNVDDPLKSRDCGPNMVRNDKGLCVCQPGMIQDGNDCFKCEHACHKDATCVKPGVCQCNKPLIGDGIKECYDIVPKVTNVDPKSGPATGGTSVTITLESNIPNAVSVAYCRFGSSVVRAHSAHGNKVLCISPSHDEAVLSVAFSYDRVHWSTGNFTFSFKNDPELLDEILEHYHILLIVILLFAAACFVALRRDKAAATKSVLSDEGVKVVSTTYRKDADPEDPEREAFQAKKRVHLD